MLTIQKLELHCVKHIFGAFWEMIPALRQQKGQGKFQMLQVPKQNSGSKLFLWHYVEISIFKRSTLPQHTWAMMPLSCSVSKAVGANLHRKTLCISNSWDTVLPSSLTDLQGDACCADMLVCMSPLPPTALCSHFLNNHSWLWQQALTNVYRICAHTNVHYLSLTHSYVHPSGQPSS